MAQRKANREALKPKQIKVKSSQAGVNIRTCQQARVAGQAPVTETAAGSRKDGRDRQTIRSGAIGLFSLRVMVASLSDLHNWVLSG